MSTLILILEISMGLKKGTERIL